MVIKDKAHRQVKHPYESCPPHQQRYQHGTDDWNLETTACETTSKKINTLDNSSVMSNSSKCQFPVVDLEHDSPNIFRSTTDGKGRR